MGWKNLKLEKSWGKIGNKLGTCWEQVEKKFEKIEKIWKKVGKKLEKLDISVWIK